MSDENTSGSVPPGFNLRYTLQGRASRIKRIAWSPNGQLLASPSKNKTINLWDTSTGKALCVLKGHGGAVYSVAWAPDGTKIASGSNDQTIRLWEVKSGQLLQTINAHLNRVTSVAWSPNGNQLASGSFDKTIRLWDVDTGNLLRTFTGHSSSITGVLWSPYGKLLASSSGDRTVRLWDAHTGQQLQILTGHTRSVRHLAWSSDGKMLATSSSDQTIHLWAINAEQVASHIGILEGHTGQVTCTSFSYDDHFLASKSDDGTVRLWNIDTLDTLAILDESTVINATTGLAFHPTAPSLATLGENDEIIRIWDLDISTLLANSKTSIVHYTNAKVILVGDTGVGKSGLGLVLTGQSFVATDSTHGRYVWIFENQEVELEQHIKEIHEILLWDLAGQPSYRLIHQLHLQEVAVALVIFDSHSTTDPFEGVLHWHRALRKAQSLQEASGLPLRKFLVAARTDRGGISVSSERINTFLHELEFDGYFETSAKEGKNITELVEAIREAIDWSILPKVSSTNLFQEIKSFLLFEKETGRLLSTANDLYRAFLSYGNTFAEDEELYAQFETCIGRVEARGLIRKLSFGNLVLLQPELLDIYASALINAMKDEPDGMGSIAEEKVWSGDFPVPKEHRLKDKEQEKLLLIAMAEDLLHHEIVLREQAADGVYLIFPTESTRENPDLPDLEGKSVIFSFEGPVLNIYATLAVRLSQSGMFKKKDLWRNAITYTTKIGGMCGIFLSNTGEGYAQLILFFDERTGEETRFYFEDYVQTHLQRWALSESIKRRRIFVCSNPTCATSFSDTQVTRRRELGFNWIRCSVCDTHISLLDREERLRVPPTSAVQSMDRAADAQREYEVAQSTLRGKIATNDFDVFLCHNIKDKPVVKEIGEMLKGKGILPWLDEWELRPGLPWQTLLEQQIDRIKAVAVFVGKEGIGPWQHMELNAFLREFVNRGNPVIPILLPEASEEPELPIFLKSMTWVDFRQQSPDPTEQLIWGITGERGDVRFAYLA